MDQPYAAMLETNAVEADAITQTLTPASMVSFVLKETKSAKATYVTILLLPLVSMAAMLLKTSYVGLELKLVDMETVCIKNNRN